MEMFRDGVSGTSTLSSVPREHLVGDFSHWSQGTMPCFLALSIGQAVSVRRAKTLRW